MVQGHATSEGTARYAGRFAAAEAAGFYREAAGLRVASLGLGTYLGQPDEATDRAYTEAVLAAVRGGINFLDTAINYRHQHSERSIGAALHLLFNAVEIQRDELVVGTKAGFLTPGAVPAALAEDDVVGGMHSMAPAFLADQIDRSRANLQLDTLDIFYLHNPETQLQFVARDVFDRRLGRAFAQLEQLVAERKICYYGAATWDGFRRSGQLELVRMLELAREMGGERHHFRFIQLPFNLAMVEAFTGKPESVLETAARNGITVVASATLLQSRLAGQMPDAVIERIPGLASNAQRGIQFTRSTPGITVALVGMSRAEHVRENLGVAAVAPADRAGYLRLYE